MPPGSVDIVTTPGLEYFTDGFTKSDILHQMYQLPDDIPVVFQLHVWFVPSVILEHPLIQLSLMIDS